MIEVKLVYCDTRWKAEIQVAENRLQELFKEGFLMMRADVAERAIVYILTRQLTQSASNA